MNTDVYEGEEWSEYSSRVQACCDMFGPVDLLSLMEAEEERMKVDPGFRWKTIEETHGGALLGGDIKTIKERAKAASPVHMVTDAMCPVLILHGDNDPIVPCSLSSDIFYEKIKEAGLESKADYYIIKNAGHGSREFFQPEMKDLMIQFFNEHLK
jgi:dipeptidyl aminopeptidase/acylaminoacyl peptidase